MGHLEVAHLDFFLPDGRLLLSDVSFRVGQGVSMALVGANGAGKSTLLRLIAGELEPDGGTIATSGGLGVMPQFIGSVRDERTVRDLLVCVARPVIRDAASAIDAAEQAIMERDDEAAQLSYAQALSDWADVGGYEAETAWDKCTMAALGAPYERAQWRDVRTLSGGEQKRLVLEALLRGPDQVLLLDEPDNYLDVPGKRWLEEQLRQTPKTVLFVSHDRELLAQAASSIASVEPGPGGSDVWVHGSGFATYHEARVARFERFEELRRRWDEKHAQLVRLVADLQQWASRSSGMAARYAAAQTRLRKFEEAGPPPEPPRRQDIRMRLRGGRTGVRAVTCARLELTGLMRPFDLEVWYGERVAVLGSNGSGKSHFLRLLAGQDVAHTGAWKLGARVVPGFFAQTHAHPELAGRTLAAILWDAHAADRGAAMAALRRYELHRQADQVFGTLSGGQQARFQILLLELQGATALLLDEPTDNLDLESAEALQDALEAYEGTVIGVTHDRWFARSFDRFLIFGSDGVVRETAAPSWDEARVERVRLPVASRAASRAGCRAGEAQQGERGLGVACCLAGGGRGVEAEQPAAVPLAEQQREQRLGKGRAVLAQLHADALGQPRDVPRVAAGMQDQGELGEPAGLRDHQPVQADQLVGVHPEDDARRQRRQPLARRGVQAHRAGQVCHHRGEQAWLVTEIRVERPLGHLRGGRQFLHRGVPEPRPQEDPEGGGEDLRLPRPALGGGGPSPLANRGNS
jgi:ATPase subunit of ABC transporter with duplicated ATPase domains